MQKSVFVNVSVCEGVRVTQGLVAWILSAAISIKSV